jgi:hypothetical protein
LQTGDQHKDREYFHQGNLVVWLSEKQNVVQGAVQNQNIKL